MLWNNRSVLLMGADLVQIYQCFCDQTRLRILHLLAGSSLCVCHLEEILGEPQVKISKHLAYLRKRGMVMTDRERNWIIYSLPQPRAAELEKNLRCLLECVQTDPVFRRDLQRLKKLQESCCEPKRLFESGRRQRKWNGKTKSTLHLRS